MTHSTPECYKEKKQLGNTSIKMTKCSCCDYVPTCENRLLPKELEKNE